MAKLRSKGSSATGSCATTTWCRCRSCPGASSTTSIATEATAARNVTRSRRSAAWSASSRSAAGLTSGRGDGSVSATVADAYLPEGEWYELPVFEGE